MLIVGESGGIGTTAKQKRCDEFIRRCESLWPTWQGLPAGAGSLEGLISQQGHEGPAATFLKTGVPRQNMCVHVRVCYFYFLLCIMKMLYMAV